MATLNKVTDSALKALTKNNPEKNIKIVDGEGLYVLHTPAGGKYWQLAYRYNGKQKIFSIGVYPDISIGAAREKKNEAKRLLAQNIDPSAHKQEIKAREKVHSQAALKTFEHVAREWIKVKSPGWTDKYTQTVLTRLTNLLFPIIGNKPIDKLEGPDFLEPIKTVEKKSSIIAHRLANYCNQIGKYAFISGKIKYNAAAGLGSAIKTVADGHFQAITDLCEFGKMLNMIDS